MFYQYRIIDGVIKKVNASTVRQKAMKILSDPSYLENARKIQRKLESYRGASEAAEIIFELIS